MCVAFRLPPSVPPSIPPCSLTGLSAESGWSKGEDREYLAPPRLPRGSLGGGVQGVTDQNTLIIPSYVNGGHIWSERGRKSESKL